MSTVQGSEKRKRTALVSTRWSPEELMSLDETASYAGCSRAELIRRAVLRDQRSILPSRELVAAVLRVGSSIDAFTRAVSRGEPIRRSALDEVYAELLAATIQLRS